MKIEDNKNLQDTFMLEFSKQLEENIMQTLATKEQVECLSQELNKISKYIKKFMQQVDFQKIFETMLPPLQALSIEITNAKNDSDSLINYMTYVKKLAIYYWVIPYNINTAELKDIFEKINTEIEFDNYMEKYFDSSKIESIFDEIEKKIKYEHKQVLTQIKEAFYNKHFALINTTIISIIDDELSYYTKNKKDTLRTNIFTPIIQDLSRISIKECNWINIMYLKMLNNNINTLFAKVDFNNIEINTNKSVRRHCTQHGKKYSNNKIDSLMLINTLYHLLYVKESLKKYESQLIIMRKNKTLQYIIDNNKK